MKKLLLYISAFFIIMACSDDSNSNAESANDGQGGSLAIFALKGNYLYTVDHSKLNVFSLLDAAGPVKVNEMTVGWEIETLFSHEDYLYIGSRAGMYIYSITNPESPQMVSSVQHFTACDPVVSNGTHTFVTLHSNTACGNNINMLEVYNTSNPNNPVMVHRRNLVHPKGLGLYGNYLFVCDDEIKIFNVENPEQPVLAGSIARECFDVIIRGNDLFAIGDKKVSRYALNPAQITDITLKSEVNF